MIVIRFVLGAAFKAASSLSTVRIPSQPSSGNKSPVPMKPIAVDVGQQVHSDSFGDEVLDLRGSGKTRRSSTHRTQGAYYLR